VFRWLELDESNTSYIEKPLLIRYEINGCRRFYRPDALVRRADGLECLEVMFEVDACKLEAKWEAIGVGFRVVTERHVRRDPLHSNVRTVFAARHQRPLPNLARDMLDGVRKSGSAVAREIQSAFGLIFGNVCFLIRHGLLAADLESAPLSGETEVRWSTRGSIDPWRAGA
jgi:hypothetical protein